MCSRAVGPSIIVVVVVVVIARRHSQRPMDVAIGGGARSVAYRPSALHGPLHPPIHRAALYALLPNARASTAPRLRTKACVMCRVSPSHLGVRRRRDGVIATPQGVGRRPRCLRSPHTHPHTLHTAHCSLTHHAASPDVPSSPARASPGATSGGLTARLRPPRWPPLARLKAFDCLFFTGELLIGTPALRDSIWGRLFCI